MACQPMKPPSPPTDPSALTTRHSRVVSSSPVYYGWVVLLAATFGMLMTTPGQTLGVAIFLDRIIAELGLSRASVSLMYTVGTLVGSFSLPFIGRFIDHKGPRTAVIVISAMFALACVWMGFVGGPVALLVGFILIRGLGQGALGLVSLHVINLWFVRRRGFAVGLSGLGMAVATALFPFVIEALIGAFGWRLAYIILGGLVAVTILPLGAWLYRGRPELYGLQPDSAAQKTRAKPPHERAYTLAQARTTLTFRLFSVSDFLVAALGTGLIFHHYDIMASSGVDRLAAAAVFVPFGFITAGTNLLTGVLMDRVPPRFLLSVMLLLLCASLAFAPYVTTPGLVLAYGVILGLSQGMKGAIQGSVYAYYFGREHIGAIKGFAITLSVAGTAFGPLLFALGTDWFGSYTPILFISTLPPLMVALVAPFLAPLKTDSSVN